MESLTICFTYFLIYSNRLCRLCVRERESAIFYSTKQKSFHREFGNCIELLFGLCKSVRIHKKLYSCICIFLLFIHQRWIMLKHFFSALGFGLCSCTGKWNVYGSNWESNSILFFFWILNIAQKCVRMYIWRPTRCLTTS